jgi:hypothetical protein
MRQLWKEFKRSIRSFRIWFPVLFADRWFDSVYLLEIIARKCRADAIAYELHGMGVDHLEIANELWEVHSICQRLANVDASYYDEQIDKHNEKWKEAHVPSLYPRTEESQKLEHEEWLTAMKKGTEALEKDTDRLATLFKKVYTWSD